jgi:hypothetical protein
MRLVLLAIILTQFLLYKGKERSLLERIDYLLEFKTPKCQEKECPKVVCHEPKTIEKIVEVVRDCEPCRNDCTDEFWDY